MKTIKTRINQALHLQLDGTDSIDKIIAIAYYMGAEAAVKQHSDKVNAVFRAQKERAEVCRYHKLAMQIQGDVDYVYDSHHAGDITATFGDDETDL